MNADMVMNGVQLKTFIVCRRDYGRYRATPLRLGCPYGDLVKMLVGLSRKTKDLCQTICINVLHHNIWGYEHRSDEHEFNLQFIGYVCLLCPARGN